MGSNALRPLLKMFNKNFQGPLHLAVLNDDFAAINLLKHNPELMQRKNYLGFTALELADLLGKQNAVGILLPKIYPPIAIQGKDDSEVGYYSRQEFEKFFGIAYVQNPYFERLELLEELIANCPWLLLHTVVGEEHRSLGSALRNALFTGKVADVAIKWISDEMGYGLFAQKLIAKESFIGQYTGVVRKIACFNKDKIALNAYCMHLPTRFWSLRYFLIDALGAGNELRFANHSGLPTMKPFCLIDRSLVHIGFFATRQIKAGEELTFDYGKDYWKQRTKIGV